MPQRHRGKQKAMRYSAHSTAASASERAAKSCLFWLSSSSGLNDPQRGACGPYQLLGLWEYLVHGLNHLCAACSGPPLHASRLRIHVTSWAFRDAGAGGGDPTALSMTLL